MKKDIKEVASRALQKVKETTANVWKKTCEVASKVWKKTKDISSGAWNKTKEISSRALDKVKELLARFEEKLKTIAPSVDLKVKKGILITLASIVALGIVFAVAVGIYSRDTHTFKNDKCENCGISSSIVYKFAYISESDSYSVSGRSIWKNRYDDVIIPSEHKGKPVTVIADEAFSDCKNITVVKLPESIDTIGTGAFAYCSRLAEIDLSEGVSVIEYAAFYNCVSLRALTLPNSVSTIGEVAFDGCKSLKTLTVGTGLTSVHHSAFASCNVDSIAGGGDLFYVKDNCLIAPILKKGSDVPRITVVVGSNNSVIPEEAVAIGSYAFSGRLGLKTVELPATITVVEPYAFYECDGITGASLGSAETIGYRAFYSCESLAELTIPDATTTIQEEAFHSCILLTEVIIPDSVTTIGASAFSNCGSLKEVVIGSGVTRIEAKAFLLCHALSSVTFKNSDGWWITKDAEATSGEAIPQTELDSTAKAAELLYTTYPYYIWQKN